jgi:hypothetical protein
MGSSTHIGPTVRFFTWAWQTLVKTTNFFTEILVCLFFCLNLVFNSFKNIFTEPGRSVNESHKGYADTHDQYYILLH